MLCRICLLINAEVLNMFDENGMKWNISLIVAKHLCFEPKENDIVSTYICCKCWKELSSFHDFYINIKNAQEKRFTEVAVEEKRTDQINVKEDKEDNDSEIMDEHSYDNNEENISRPDGFAGNFACIKSENSLAPESFLSESFNEEHEHKLEKESGELDDVNSEMHHKNINAEECSKINCKKNEEQCKKNVSTVVESLSSSKRKLKIRRKCRKIISSGENDCKDKSKNSENNLEKGENISSDEANEAVREKSNAKDERIANVLKFTCDLCEKETKNFAQLKHHFRSEHDKKGYLICCGIKFYTKFILMDHVNKHVNPNDFTCKDCKKVYANSRSLLNHMLLKHTPDEAKPFKCPNCPRRYAKQFMLAQHQTKHVPNEHRKFGCDECEKFFASKAILITHKRQIHQNMNIKMCDICAKVIRNKTLFDKHMQMHSGLEEPKAQCDECGVWLKNAGSLRSHKRRHRECLSDLKCSICEISVLHKEALRKHMRRKHSDQEFQCTICNKNFKSAVTLKEHMASHTGEILYKCSFCSKGFNSNSNMYSHRKKAHKKEWEEEKRKKDLERGIL